VPITQAAEAEQPSDSVSSRVNASFDDAQEAVASGNIFRESTDLRMCHAGSHQIFAFRFTGITVPPGATIVTAAIQFTADSPSKSTGSPEFTIYGEATDDAATISSPNFSISNLPKTTASASWSPGAWDTDEEAGPEQKTSDLSEILQEIVDREGWSSGNAVKFIIEGPDSASDVRAAVAYDGDPDLAPLLEITYQEAPAGIEVAQTLVPVAQAAEAGVATRATVAQTLAPVTQAAAAGIAGQVTIVQALAPLTQAAAVQLATPVILAQTLVPVTQAAAATAVAIPGRRPMMIHGGGISVG
jgi:hypothetical protein